MASCYNGLNLGFLFTGFVILGPPAESIHDLVRDLFADTAEEQGDPVVQKKPFTIIIFFPQGEGQKPGTTNKNSVDYTKGQATWMI